MRIYGAASRAARPFPSRRRRDSRFSLPPSGALLLATLFVDTGLVDGAVPCLRYDTRAQYAHRRRSTLSPILAMELVRGHAYSPSATSSAHESQSHVIVDTDRDLA